MDIDVEALQEAYKQAVKENEKIFVFQGYRLVTDYAKYLLEYLERTKISSGK